MRICFSTSKSSFLIKIPITHQMREISCLWLLNAQSRKIDKLSNLCQTSSNHKSSISFKVCSHSLETNSTPRLLTSVQRSQLSAKISVNHLLKTLSLKCSLRNYLGTFIGMLRSHSIKIKNKNQKQLSSMKINKSVTPS